MLRQSRLKCEKTDATEEQIAVNYVNSMNDSWEVGTRVGATRKELCCGKPCIVGSINRRD